MPNMRGQPVIVLLAVLCAWVGGRLSAWDAEPVSITPTARAAGATAGSDDGYRYDNRVGPQTPAGGFAAAVPSAAVEPDFAQLARAYILQMQASRRRGPGGYAPGSAYYSGQAYPGMIDGMHGGDGTRDANRYAAPSASFAQDGGDPGRDFTRRLVNTLLRERLPGGLPPLAALSGKPQANDGMGQNGGGVETARPAVRHWSGDAWALLRGNGVAPLANGALPASYGASQAGLILRYRLAPETRFRPEIYVRSTATLQQIQSETATALGVAARPLPSLPIVAALEGRFTEQASRTRFQPVAMAITMLPPFELPNRLRGEAYAQAGYVGGSFATAFAEGQFRVDHALFGFGRLESRLGGGVWGGAQKGASRFDAGPSATIAVPLARNVYGRVAVDWRFRVAGDAKPDSGPALTLSAGF